MSVRRLVVTAAAMAAIAALLAAVGPSPATTVTGLAAPQRLVDVHGPEALLVDLAGALAWSTWAWGALGLLLAAAGAVPGAVGSLARRAQRALIPSAGRRAFALLLGLGVGLGGPGAVVAAAADPAATGTDEASAQPVPDWPAATTTPVTTPATAPSAAPAPDWPTADAPAPHVVRHGDCLWRITDAWLLAREGRSPTNAEITAGVSAWWRTNAAVIGTDPDLLRPGQVLRPPEAS